MNWFRKVMDYFKNLPGNIKKGWQAYKLFAVAEFKKNKQMMDKLLHVKEFEAKYKKNGDKNE